MMSERAREFHVSDFMSKNVLIVDSDSNLSKAVEIMVAHEIGSLVVREGGRLRGMFTERDLLRALARNKRPESTLVRDAMSSVITKVAPALGSQDAARRMIDTKGRLLVFDGEKLVGIATATDIVRVIYRTGILFDINGVISKEVVTADMSTRLAFVVREMDARGVGSVILTENKVPRGIFTERDLLNRVLFLEFGLDHDVIEAATFPMVTAELGINGREVAGVMVSRHVKRLPLTRGGKIVGMVTARDLVQAYAYPNGVEDADLTIQFRVRYGELCPICSTRIDDHGLCACGAGGG